MRLDRFFSETATLTRKESAKAAKAGRITVDGTPVKDVSVHINPETCVIALDGTPVEYRRFTYVMLHKPQGYVSATEDGFSPCVTELLPDEWQKLDLFPVGRLDKDTTGLMILTDDGELAHYLLSPKHHAEKVYAFTVSDPLPKRAEARCKEGIKLADGTAFKPAILVAAPDRLSGQITLTEGKYHEIKRMAKALGTEITSLSRLVFADVPLDGALAPGESRLLTADEIAHLESYLPTRSK